MCDSETLLNAKLRCKSKCNSFTVSLYCLPPPRSEPVSPRHTSPFRALPYMLAAPLPFANLQVLPLPQAEATIAASRQLHTIVQAARHASLFHPCIVYAIAPHAAIGLFVAAPCISGSILRSARCPDDRQHLSGDLAVSACSLAVPQVCDAP